LVHTDIAAERRPASPRCALTQKSCGDGESSAAAPRRAAIADDGGR
jgi:hypothetical protein